MSWRMMEQDVERMFYERALLRLIRKLDLRIIPFMALLEINRLGFQVAISHVQLTNFKNDLYLTKEENSWATSLFYLGYMIFSVPSVLLVRLISPKRYLSLSMMLWGIIAIAMVFVKNGRELMVVRFLLGAVGAGYYTGMIIYLSLWYRKREQIMRIAIFHSATAASGVVGSMLVYGISKMNGTANLHEWQWIFLLHGMLLILLGIITCVFLGNIPDTVRWLDNSEKGMLTNLLRTDANVAEYESVSNSRLSCRQACYVFTDWRVYLYVVIAMDDLAVIKYLITYLPTIIKNMGFSKEQVFFLTIVSYTLACLNTLLVGYATKRRNEHSFCLAICLSIGILGFVLMIILIDQDKASSYVSTCIAFCGTFTALCILMSWVTNNVGGYTKRVVAAGFICALGQIGGIIMPQIHRDVDKSTTYRHDYYISIILLFIALIVTFILRFSLKKENHRRDCLSIDVYNREAAVTEPCDRHPGIRFIL